MIEEHDEVWLLEQKCMNCGAPAKKYCEGCNRTLCGRCGTKEKKDKLRNLIFYAGLCKDCVQKRNEAYDNGAINIIAEAVRKYGK